MPPQSIKSEIGDFKQFTEVYYQRERKTGNLIISRSISGQQKWSIFHFHLCLRDHVSCVEFLNISNGNLNELIRKRNKHYVRAHSSFYNGFKLLSVFNFGKRLKVSKYLYIFAFLLMHVNTSFVNNLRTPTFAQTLMIKFDQLAKPQVSYAETATADTVT